MSNRTFKSLSAALIGATLLLACGSAATGPAAATQPAAAQLAASTAAPAKSAAATPVAAAQATSAPAAPVAGGKGGNVTIALSADATSFHLYKTTDTQSSLYEGMVYQGNLTQRDPKTLDLVPFNAESWKISDDKTTYTFTLRKDIKWSDGQPITSADYKWTFEQANNPDNKYPYKVNLDPIVSYEAPDPTTLVIKEKDPLVIGLEIADTINPLPKHIWEKLDWSDPTKNPEINAPTVGSGPWLLKEWKNNDHATFTPNSNFFLGTPKLASITYRIVPNQSVQFQMLKSGEVDNASVQPSDVDEARKQPNLTVYDYDLARAAWDYIGFNLRRAPENDPDFRHALTYAIPRDLMVQKIFYGLAGPTYSNYPPGSWVYNPDVPHYDYDLNKAKQLLDSAGYKPGADGMRLSKDGKSMKLKLFYNTGNKTREQIAVIAQDQFKQIGIDSEVTGIEFAAYLKQLQNEPFDFDLYVLGWSTTIDPHYSIQIWGEKGIPSLNSGAYINKDVEALYDQGSKEFDKDKRKQIYQQIQKIIATDSPYIFLDYRKGYEVWSKRIQGLEPTSLTTAYTGPGGFRLNWTTTDGK